VLLKRGLWKTSLEHRCLPAGLALLGAWRRGIDPISALETLVFEILLAGGFDRRARALAGDGDFLGTRLGFRP